MDGQLNTNDFLYSNISNNFTYVNFVKTEDFKKRRLLPYFINSIPEIFTCLLCVKFYICMYFVIATSSLSN